MRIIVIEFFKKLLGLSPKQQFLDDLTVPLAPTPTPEIAKDPGQEIV